LVTIHHPPTKVVAGALGKPAFVKIDF
jgi:hypothetical protein